MKKYISDDLHFITRFVKVIIILTLFILHAYLFIDPNSRSCLGPPRALVFDFIGVPLILLLSLLDLIVLFIMKAFKWQKLAVNLGLISCMLLIFIFILNR